MSSDNLKSKTKKGLLWSSIERFGTQGIGFLFTIIIARILSPDDYGVIAMPMVFLALAQVFIDSGFSNALVRKQDLTEEDLSTAFYFNVIVGVVCYIALFFCSPLIADFYETPILTDLLKVTALATLFNPLCTVQQAILTKKIDFKTQAKVSLAGAVVSGVGALIMAYYGLGVWSLVFQQVGAALVRVILLWALSDWRPKTGWSKESFKYLWGYGSKLLASGLLDTTYNNIFPIVIGKFFTSAQLGNYTRAQQFTQLPSSTLTSVLQRVTFPVLSEIQDDDERLKNSYRKFLKLSAFVIFPLMLGLAAVADPLIRVLLTDKWEGCILLLQLLCFSMMWYPIHAINLNLLQVKGRSDLFLKLEIIKKAVGIAIMCFTIPHGLVWMVAGSILTSLLCLAINTFYTGKIIGVGFFVQMKDLLPTLCNCLLMWGLILIINMFIPNIYIQLIVDILIGVAVYVLLSRLFSKAEFDECLAMIPIKKK